MRKTTQLLSLLCFITMLAGCSVENEPIANDEPFSTDDPISDDDPQIETDLIIKRISRNTTDPNSNCLGRYGNFNTDGKLENIFVCDVLSTTFTYNDENLLTGLTDYGGYEYENGMLIGVLTGSDTGSGYTTVTYENNFITERLTYNGVQSESNTVYKFTDATYSRLLSITRNEAVDTTPFVSHIETFEYDGNNMVKSVTRRLDANTQELEDFEVISYTYDNKINPYQMGLTQNAHLTSRIISFYQLGASEMIAARSDNNVTIQSIWRKPLDTVYEFSFVFTHEYNDLNYPISYTVQIDDGEIVYVGDFEYYE